MGLQGSNGEVLAGDPIPDAAGAATAESYGDSSHSAIVDDENLWDHLIIEPEVITIQEEATEPEAPETPSTPATPTTEQDLDVAIVLPQQQDEPSGDSDQTGSEMEAFTEPEEEESENNSVGDVVKVVTVTVIEEEAPVVTEADEAAAKTQAFLIVIPAVVVGVLVAMAVFILIRVCTKKRAHQQIVIKKTLAEAQGIEGED